MKISFTVPGTPVPKQRPRMGQGGRWYTPSKTKHYEQLVASCALHAGARPWRHPARLTIEIYWPDNRRRDLDNAAKSIGDGLNGIAYDDDSQLIELNVSAHLDRITPRAVVTVEYDV